MHILNKNLNNFKNVIGALRLTKHKHNIKLPTAVLTVLMVNKKRGQILLKRTK